MTEGAVTEVEQAIRELVRVSPMRAAGFLATCFGRVSMTGEPTFFGLALYQAKSVRTGEVAEDALVATVKDGAETMANRAFIPARERAWQLQELRERLTG